jgi:hypothetical protein
LRRRGTCHPGRVQQEETAAGRLVYYRLYRLSGPGGRFVGFEEIEADDDVSAVHAALAFCGPYPLELWCGKRKVKSFPAGGGAPE